MKENSKYSTLNEADTASNTIHNTTDHSLELTIHTESHGDHGEEMKLPNAVYIFAFCAAFNSANLGFDCGVNTGALMKLQNSMGLTDAQIELFNGMLVLFCIPGALSSHCISDRMGRRGSFIVSAIVFILGVVSISMAPNYTFLMLSRVLVGLGVGFGFAVDPVYIAEISPAAYRGRLVTWSEIGTNIGIMLGFMSGIFFHNVPDDIAWRMMYALGTIMPCIVIPLACFVMPESPRWLIMKGREDEAASVLRRIYPPNYDVNVVIKDIQDNIRIDTQAEHAVGWDVILNPSPAFRRMILVGIIAAVSQKLVGIDAISAYFMYILDKSGIDDDFMQNALLTVCGVVKLGFVFVSARYLDSYGRRVMMMLSCFGMCLSLGILAFAFLGPESNGGLVAMSLVIYFLFFSLGMGPGAWLVPSEVFANTIRTKAMSIATSLHFVCATLMSTLSLSLFEATSYSGFFLILAAVNVGIASLFYYLLPETKGLSLEDMSHYFAEITGDSSILDLECSVCKDEQKPEYDSVLDSERDSNKGYHSSSPRNREQAGDSKVEII